MFPDYEVENFCDWEHVWPLWRNITWHFRHKLHVWKGLEGPELKHMISSSFWSLCYFHCSAPDNPHCCSYFSHSDVTHLSLSVFLLATVTFSMMKTFNFDYMPCAVCYLNGAVIHQVPWELHRGRETNVPIEPKSHMVKHSIPLWQAEKNKKEIPWSSAWFHWTQRQGVSGFVERELVNQFRCMAGHLTAHLSQTPPLLP